MQKYNNTSETQAEILKKLWAEAGRNFFDENTEEKNITKRFVTAIIEMYHADLDNKILARSLGVDVGEQKNKWYEYGTSKAISYRVAKVLDLKTNSITSILNELGVSENVDTIIKDSQKQGNYNATIK